MESPAPRLVGRYMLFAEIAAGGMATVHLGRLVGPVGFTRLVAIKRLHRHYCRDPEFVAMFLDEARIAARIRHPNVVQVLDVVPAEGELFLVMDYVDGESLSKLLRVTVEKTQRPPPPRIAAAVISGALQGLHAAHEAKGESGELLGVVHRDVSPQNILVGADGIPRVLDFGIAKSVGRMQITRAGQVKGKLAYMAPEQIRFEQGITRRTDLYAASVVLWELLTGTRLFTGDEADVVSAVLAGKVPRPSEIVRSVSDEMDALVMRGLSLEPSARFDTARDMALAVESCMGIASAAEVSDWVDKMARRTLAERAELVAALESGPNAAVTPLRPTLLRNELAAALESGPVPAVSSAGAPGSDLQTDANTELPTRPRTLSPEPAPPSRARIFAAAAAGAAGAVLIVLAMTAFDRARPATARAMEIAVPSFTSKPAVSVEEAPIASSSAVSMPVRPPASSRAPSSAPRPSANPCAVPYYFDNKGLKRYKPECL
ncbi:MAG TPA: protein kinase [Polyangiaceae bacterium]|jgi:serine/threonine-protein kinase|nr:protein kinase [Polyangiaceae bacterium]